MAVGMLHVKRVPKFKSVIILINVKDNLKKGSINE
jgi:hypothetical protein